MKRLLLAVFGIFLGAIKDRVPGMVASLFKKETHDPERTIREVMAEDEVLEKQRDTALVSVDDTDRMWSDWGNQGKH